MQRLVAVGQVGDELVRAGEPGGPLDRRVRRVGIGEGDVGAHRVVEQERVLEDDADRVPQVVNPEVAHVDAVDAATAPDVDVVEARDQPGDRRLAASRSRRRAPPTRRARPPGRGRQVPVRLRPRSRSDTDSNRTSPSAPARACAVGSLRGCGWSTICGSVPSTSATRPRRSGGALALRDDHGRSSATAR